MQQARTSRRRPGRRRVRRPQQIQPAVRPRIDSRPQCVDARRPVLDDVQVLAGAHVLAGQQLPGPALPRACAFSCCELPAGARRRVLRAGRRAGRRSGRSSRLQRTGRLPIDPRQHRTSRRPRPTPHPHTACSRVSRDCCECACWRAAGRGRHGRVAGILIISVRSGAVRRDVRPVSGVRRARATWTDSQRMVPATGSVTTISMVLFCLSGPGTFRFEREFWAGSGEFSVPRSLRTPRSARSPPIFRSVHGLCYAPGEAERIP